MSKWHNKLLLWYDTLGSACNLDALWRSSFVLINYGQWSKHMLSDMWPCLWIPGHWLLSARKAMHNNNITTCYDTWTIPPLHKHDQFLMDDFCDYGIPSNQLEKLNACWMYLHVTTLAEITNQIETTLLPQALASLLYSTPKGLTNISTSLLKWPHIHPPYSSCWWLWSRLIQTLYTGSSTGTRHKVTSTTCILDPAVQQISILALVIGGSWPPCLPFLSNSTNTSSHTSSLLLQLY